jgi:hypothetical protein
MLLLQKPAITNIDAGIVQPVEHNARLWKNCAESWEDKGDQQ